MKRVINFGCDRSKGSSGSIATVVVSIATNLIFDVFLKNLIILVGLQKFSIRINKFYS